MTLIIKRTYEKCAAFLEIRREEMERYHKEGEIKDVKIGDRAYLQHYTEEERESNVTTMVRWCISSNQ